MIWNTSSIHVFETNFIQNCSALNHMDVLIYTNWSQTLFLIHKNLQSVSNEYLFSTILLHCPIMLWSDSSVLLLKYYKYLPRIVRTSSIIKWFFPCYHNYDEMNEAQGDHQHIKWIPKKEEIRDVLWFFDWRLTSDQPQEHWDTDQNICYYLP